MTGDVKEDARDEPAPGQPDNRGVSSPAPAEGGDNTPGAGSAQG